MCTEVAAAVDNWVEVQGRKKAKLAPRVSVVTSLHSPSVAGVLGASYIIHHTVPMAETRDVNRGKRQYMTRSRAGKSLTAEVAAVSIGRASRTQFEATSKLVERLEDSDPPTPSL
jgi:hypothetical protein